MRRPSARDRAARRRRRAARAASSAALRRGLGRRLEPAQRAEPGEPGAVELERRAGEIRARDLRHLERAPGVVIVLRVEPHHAARTRAARAARALRAARAAHRLDLRATAARSTASGARSARGRCRSRRPRRRSSPSVSATLVDEDHLAPARRPHRAVLLVGGQVAVQRQHGEVEQRARRRRGPRRSAGSRRRPAGTRARRRRACPARARRTAAATCLPSGRSSGCSTCSIATGNVRPSERTTGASPRNAATGSASSVADITTSASSGRRARSRATSASARSPSRWRSWNSSMITQPTPRSSGSTSSRRVSTPSVTNRSRVARGRPCDRSAPRSRPRRRARRRARSATRAAASRAASRRGCSTTTSPLDHARVEQRARDARRLAGARRRDQHGTAPLAHRRDQPRQHVVDR